MIRTYRRRDWRTDFGCRTSRRERRGVPVLPELLTHVSKVDSCDCADAQRQIRSALIDRAFGPLRWEDRIQSPSGPTGGATIPIDIPPLDAGSWCDAEINWKAGTVLD